MAYRLFVDDSGNREYSGTRDYRSVDGKSRYFVYGALLAEEREANFLIERFRQLKTTTFDTAKVEIKSNWLRIPHERNTRYLETFGVTLEELQAFTEQIYRLLRVSKLELLAAIVDKSHMQEDYHEPWYPPTVAYDLLAQRAVQASPEAGSVSVTIDNISGATPHRNEYRTLLERHHDQLRQTGSRLRPGLSFAPLTGPIRFINSQLSDLIQLADLVAYNVHRQFRDHGEHWETTPAAGGTLPMYDHFREIAGKFRHDGTGRIQGYGIAKFPLRKRVRWTVAPGAKEGT